MKTIIILIIIIFSGIEIAFAQQTDTIKHQIEQVTVTATRYPENVLEIPYAVTIMTKEQFSDIKGYGLDEVLSTVPGVIGQSRSGNQDVRIVIRGFGARGSGDRSNSGTSRGIRIMQDGIPETEPDGRTSFDNVDLSISENIEVIRSNSSALWGNAGGGIINISSVSDFRSPYLKLNGLGGSFGLRKFTLQGGAFLGAGRLSLSISDITSDGWRKHSASKRTIVNLSLRSELSDATQLSVYLTGTGNLFHIPGPLTQQQYDSDPQQANPVYESRDERRYNRLGRIGVTLDHSINEMHEISGMAFVNPKYLQRSERGTYRDFTRYHFGGNFLYRNNAGTGSLKNQLTLGIDEAYQDGAILFYSLSSTNGRGNELRDNKREGANTFGAFFQDEVRIGSLSIIAGGRYDRVTYYSESYINPELGLQSKTFGRFTPKGGVTYMFSPTHSIYANLGGGVEVPAGNETDPASTYGQDTVYLLNPLLDPITSTTIEAGTKHLIFIGYDAFIESLSYDAALYYIIVNDDIIPYRGGRFYFTAGRTTRAGIETGINIQMNYGLSLQGSFTYSHNEYDEYMVDSAHYGNAGAFADFAGNKTAGIPDVFYFAGINYAPSFFYGAYLGVSFNGMGEYFADDANSITVPSYDIISLTAGLKDPLKITSDISISGFVSVSNITDRKYAASAFINPDIVNGQPVYLEPGLPRNITASISVAFN